METPFKAVEFTKHETITRDMLTTVQNNNQWLKDNTPRGRSIYENGAVIEKNTVIVCGRIHIPRNKKSATYKAPVRLGRAFAPRSRPHVTTGIVSEHAREIFCIVNGPNGELLPRGTGFDITICADDAASGTRARRWAIAKGFFVNWQAMGYRTDDMNEF